MQELRLALVDIISSTGPPLSIGRGGSQRCAPGELGYRPSAARSAQAPTLARVGESVSGLADGSTDEWDRLRFGHLIGS
jgi:hypothetical protein